MKISPLSQNIIVTCPVTREKPKPTVGILFQKYYNYFLWEYPECFRISN